MDANDALKADDLELEAIDLGGIDVLEDDLVPCTCCGDHCNCPPD